MMRPAFAVLVLAIAAGVASAQDAPEPEECLANAKDSSALVATHRGKTYRFKYEACRDQFLTDPERYSQLYDALLELEAEGTPLTVPDTPSLVPS